MTEPLDILMPWMLGGYSLLLISLRLSRFGYYYLVDFAKLARAREYNGKDAARHRLSHDYRYRQ